MPSLKKVDPARLEDDEKAIRQEKRNKIKHREFKERHKDYSFHSCRRKKNPAFTFRPGPNNNNNKAAARYVAR